VLEAELELQQLSSMLCNTITTNRASTATKYEPLMIVCLYTYRFLGCSSLFGCSGTRDELCVSGAFRICILFYCR